MQHLPEEEFRTLFSVQDYLDSCHRAYRMYGSGELVNPPRIETASKGSFRLEMSAEWPGRYRMRKVIDERSDVDSGRLGAREAIIELEDLQRRATTCMDADFLTDARTGAGGAQAVRYLAGGAVRSIGIIGTGRVARALALAVDQLFELDEIAVTSRKLESRSSLRDQIEPQVCASIRLVSSVSDCLEGVEVAITAVPTPIPILSQPQVRGISALVVMAGDGRTRQLEPAILELGQIVVDDLDQARKSGEFLQAAEEGRQEKFGLMRGAGDKILNIGDAACGRLPGGDGRLPIAYLTGLAVQDLCAAVMVYERMSGLQVT